MSTISRRRFLQLTGGAAAFAALSPSIARAASIAPRRRTGGIDDVEHVVVLMQENRSFDHYFGSLSGVRGFGDPRPVTLPSGKPVWYQADGGTEVLPFRPDVDDLGLHFIQDLNHDWAGSQAAFHAGDYDRWLPAKTATTMAYLTRDDIPFHYALADAFTVCDAYHCSFIGSTDPNRYYLWTGYTGNDGTGGGPVLGNEEAGYGWTTYPERLQAAGVSWKVYQDIGDGLDQAGSWGWIDDAYRGTYGDNSLLYFDPYRTAQPGDPLYDKARTGTDAKRGDGYFDRLAADVQAGTLPQVCWIVAPEAFSEHPNWPANYGAWYLARVLDALTADPDVWASTVLLITYDENDGFFDHVVPPYPPAAADRGLSTVDVSADLYPGGDGYAAGPYGLGPRVPMVVASPFSRGGYVCSQTFDHTSVIRFIERRFGVTEPHISPWRRAVCGDLTTAFDFAVPDTSEVRLPGTDQYAPPDHDRHPPYVPDPPDQPVLPRQERGARRTRPLPYRLHVDAAAPGDGSCTLTFAAGDDAGASFQIRSNSRTDGPWTYTVGPGDTVHDTWHFSDRYQLSVFGPNGFLREVAGAVGSAGPEVTARDTDSGAVTLTVTNPTAAAVELTLHDAYTGTDRTLRVAAGATHTRTVDLAASHRWYDLTVRGGDGYLRRFAGHVETGAPGVTDPAIGTG